MKTSGGEEQFSLVRWIRDPDGQASGSGFLTEPWSRVPLDGGSPP